MNLSPSLVTRQFVLGLCLLTGPLARAVPEAFVTFDLSTNPAWTATGSWAHGTPSGAGGDPVAAKTGTAVYGNNLAGTYAASIPAGTPHTLTTTAINCTGRQQVKLGFWRWLGVESPTWDKVHIHASNDGTTWVQVWTNPSSVIESAWSYQQYDIAAVADNQPTVYIRWSLGPTDGGGQYAGWNLDDISLLADNGVTGVSVTATDATATETGPTTGTFTFTRSGSTAAALTANINFAGTASGGDVTSLPGTVTFAAGSATQTLVVTPGDDALPEGAETLSVTVQAGAGYGPLAPDTASLTIADNDQPTVTVATTRTSTLESGGLPGEFTLTRTAPLTAPLNVVYSLGGVATQGTDYTALSGVATLAAGQASAVVSIAPLDDAILEGSETVNITLQANGLLYILGGGTFASLTLLDDEQNEVSIAASDASANEDTLDPGVFTLTRTAPLGAALTVNLTHTGTAASGADYVALPGTAVFPAGAATTTITVTPVDDAGADSPETVQATLQSGGLAYRIGTPSSATVTLTDADVPVGVSVTATTPQAYESFAGTGYLQFSRTGPTTSALTVNLSVSGTANAADASAIPATVTFAAGASTASLGATAVNDTLPEGPETIVVSVAPGAGYGAAQPATATITVVDDDQSEITLYSFDSSASESGGDTGSFNFYRGSPSAGALTVDLTITGTAANGTDYTTLPTSITFAAGATSTSLTLTPIDDALLEGPETVVVSIAANGTNYRAGSPTTATVTLADNEQSSVNIYANDDLAVEGGTDAGLFRLTRTSPTTAALTVQLAIAGTAQNGADYATLATSVVIPAGSSQVDIPVTALNDAALEGTETVVCQIAPNGVQYGVGSSSNATVRILDDEQPVVTISASVTSLPESGASSSTLTLTRTPPLGAAIQVQVALSGTATPGSDFSAPPQFLSLPAGVASTTFSLTALQDTALEGPETVIVTVVESQPAYRLGSPSSASVSIQDDDLPVVSVTASDASATEAAGDAGQYTITRTPPLAGPLTVTFSFAYSGAYALEGSDFSSIGTSVTIADGAASAQVNLQPLDDAVVEPVEFATLVLSSRPAFYVIGTPSSAAVRILDNEPTQLVLDSFDAFAGEDGDFALVRVQRRGALAPDLNVQFAWSGDATAGSDYQAMAGAYAMEAGNDEMYLILRGLNDALVEGTESIRCALLAGAGYTLGTTTSATAYVVDNDFSSFSTVNVDIVWDNAAPVHASANGVYSAAGGTTWNTNLLPDFAKLKDQFNTAKTVEVDFEAKSINSAGSSTPYADGYGGVGNGSAIYFYNLNPTRTYDVAIYYYNSTVRGTAFSATTNLVKTSSSSLGTATMPGTAGGDYLLFEDLQPLRFASGHTGLRVLSNPIGGSNSVMVAAQIREHSLRPYCFTSRSGNTLNVQVIQTVNGGTYHLERSSDLRNWSTVQTFTGNGGTQILPQAMGTALNAYFRIRQ